jgi:Protein of unknown function (DUF1203)
MTANITPAVHAIDPGRLDAVRSAGQDGWGNSFESRIATGEGEPLRCCLRYARAGERVALMSFAPFMERSPWREVGPVYVHFDQCEGYAGGSLPEELRHGPCVLRAYRPDGSMNYEHNTLVGEEDIAPLLERLLAEPEVAVVHVRTVRPQCFLFAATR